MVLPPFAQEDGNRVAMATSTQIKRSHMHALSSAARRPTAAVAGPELDRTQRGYVVKEGTKAGSKRTGSTDLRRWMGISRNELWNV
jgi:hypothetical protein